MKGGFIMLHTFLAEAPTITYWTISDGLLSPLMTSITTNINAAVPYGLAIMGSFLGINVLKRVLFSFL